MSLDSIPIPALFFLTAALSLAAIEAGRWFGRRRKKEGAEPESTVGASVGATLGLLAFVLAFTFSMAASRFDLRRQMVVDDANSIGTTYLRTSLLPEPAASSIRRLLREYVEVRLNISRHPEQMVAGFARSEEIQNELWRQATALANAQPTLTTTPLFIQSLNEMIDVHALRLAAVRSRIPLAIWMSMFVTTAIGMLTLGYQAGLNSARRSLAVTGLALAFAGIIMLIADLDRPMQGFLRVSQQSLTDLQQSMQADATAQSEPY